MPEAVKMLEEVKAIAGARKIGWKVKLLKRKVQMDKAREASDARKEKILDKIEDILTVKQRAKLVICIGDQIRDKKDAGPSGVMINAIKAVESELELKEKQQKKKDKFLEFVSAKQTEARDRFAPVMASLKEAVEKDDMATAEEILGKIKASMKDMKKNRKVVMDEMKSTFEPEQMAIIMLHLMTKRQGNMKTALAAI
mmetsp:Transcript_212/g.226  ORF Transcript_212/g.226 Transcript_212/m.226 type:complete len:198 (-) Transcript_212:58-651(-)